jgi:hypothetical protein
MKMRCLTNAWAGTAIALPIVGLFWPGGPEGFVVGGLAACYAFACLTVFLVVFKLTSRLIG